MKKEIWKDIVGQEGKYQISNLGNVKSLSKIGQSQTNKYYFHCKPERILKPFKVGLGYLCVVFKYKGEKKYVHRLVCEAFIPNPENKKTVNHKNGIKVDNSVQNLEWATQLENNNHAIKTKLRGKKNTHISHNLISRINSPINQISL